MAALDVSSARAGADAATSNMLAENVNNVLERLRVMMISSVYEVDLREIASHRRTVPFCFRSVVGISQSATV